MNNYTIEQKMQILNQRMRILILQNVRENIQYDDKALLEMRDLADQIIKLKNKLKNQNKMVYDSKSSGFVNSLVGQS